MRGSLIICILLSTAVLANSRPKRSLGYFKNLVTNKIFGGNSVVIARPVLAKNQTYQLFKIPGIDDIYIKVSKKGNKTKPHEKDKVKPDPVIVKPEVAIIGSYLGTTTEKETLLAIEMVKSLLQSGILTGGQDNWIEELVIPRPSHSKYVDERNVNLPTQVLAEEQGHILVPINMQQVNRNTIQIPVYPEISTFVSPEVKPTLVQSKYSYKQKGPEADMTYESYNNKDVIVTRTEKEPLLPQFIKMRIVDVANIGAKPYLIQSPLRVNPYSYSNPGMVLPEMLPYLSHRIGKPNSKGTVAPGYNNVNDAPIFVDKNPLLLSKPIGNPTDSMSSSYFYGNNVKQVIRCQEKSVDRVCPYDDKSRIRNNQNLLNTSSSLANPSNQHNEVNKGIKGESNANTVAVNEFLRNHSINGQLVSQYIYKQINHHSHDNYTKVNVGNNIQTTKDKVGTMGMNLHRDFVFIPPKTADSPLLSALSLNNQDSKHTKDDTNAFTSKYEKSDFIDHPIVVLDTVNGEKRSNSDHADENKTFDEENYNENSNRGDIPGSDY